MSNFVDTIADRYGVIRREYGLPAHEALRLARENSPTLWFQLYQRRAREIRRQRTKRVTVNMLGFRQLECMAEDKGVTVRELFEALMHYAISQHERPGSWEANGPFDLANYGPDGYADKWF